MKKSKILKDVGEQGILKLVQRFCPANIIGDDAAVVAIAAGQSLVVTTDVLVEGVHFSDATTSPEDVGWRSAAANLSDLAAMGASPIGITVGLALRGDVALNWVESFYQGLYNCLQQYQTPILGGDVCRSPVVTVSITALGQVIPQRAIYRSGARAGDAIVVTGDHGAARGGLELLLHPELGQNLQEAERQALIQSHQRPKPRLDVLPILDEIFEFVPSSAPVRAKHLGNKLQGRFSTETPNALPLPTGMDSSDGLADAVVQICRASGVGAEIDRNLIPIPEALRQLAGRDRALEWALYGGEDFELVFCLRGDLAAFFVERLGGNAAIIGKITAGEEVLVTDSRGVYPQQVLSLEQGFQHFSI